MSCARCADPEVVTEASDVADRSAPLCGPCGHLWLCAVVGDWDASLAIFTGSATAAERSAHAAAVAKREAAEADAAREKEAERERVRLRKAERARLADEAADARSRQILALVTERPRTVSEIENTLGLSKKTTSRALRDAKQRGYVTTRSGVGAMVRPAA